MINFDSGRDKAEELKGREIYLHNEEKSIRGTKFLIDKQTALRTQGINGNILAILTLPSVDGVDTQKQIGIIDYGEPDSNGKMPYILYLLDEDNPVKIFGRVPSRFGLYGLNYTPKERMMPFNPLEEGVTLLGRDNNTGRASYMLGLTEEYADNDAISRKHCSIIMESNGALSIIDHSSNGTTLLIPE
jgi:hypothetical protein